MFPAEEDFHANQAETADGTLKDVSQENTYEFVAKNPPISDGFEGLLRFLKSESKFCPI